MKVIILSTSDIIRQQLSVFLTNENHVVVGSSAVIDSTVLEQLARTSPHFIVTAASELSSDAESVLHSLRRSFLDIGIIQLAVDPNSHLTQDWKDTLTEKLGETLSLYTAHTYGEGKRIVFHDPMFRNLRSPQKLKQPNPRRRSDRQLADESRRFRKLLAGARAGHDHAHDYLHAIQGRLGLLEWELAYRHVHNSYKGLCWSRDLVGVFTAVLAHYVPGLKREYLPKPAGVHPQLDYVHYAMPVENEYAIMAVTALQPSPSITEMLLATTQIYFTGQSDPVLLQFSCTWWGLAHLMRFVAEAHLSVMNRWLEKDDSVFDEEQDRLFHRRLGIVINFWDLHTLFQNPRHWQKILRLYWKNPNHRDFQFPDEEFVSFQDILRSR